MEELQSIVWHNGRVRILDQTRLPGELVLLEISDHHGVVKAIKQLSIRGAPAIGIAAAYGVVLSIWEMEESDRSAFFERVNQAIELLRASRPTAKNLFWALESMRQVLTRHLNRPVHEIRGALLQEAQRIQADDLERCRQIGRYGAALLTPSCAVLTHCNAGALATAGHGTALGIVRSAISLGKKVRVFACETRPLLQGARITAFELHEDAIPVTVLCDNMAAHVMSRSMVQFVIVGADRIARNGDTANKIGTFGLAILARHFRIPFYVAAPLSTFDLDLRNGEQIPIENRGDEEVRCCGSLTAVPEGVPVLNPAFDVTPGALIDAFITEKGILRSPYDASLDPIKNLNLIP